MAKRDTGPARPKKTRSRKTQKRLTAKVAMLTKKAAGRRKKEK